MQTNAGHTTLQYTHFIYREATDGCSGGPIGNKMEEYCHQHFTVTPQQYIGYTLRHCTNCVCGGVLYCWHIRIGVRICMYVLRRYTI
jgi:hypothetical protein